ncbi:MerR family transcriptional regulator [Nesterenkonia flava]|uniref:MerR family transcriptional regulator n=1 Tax=Nesterenkonia flava TaxID=469799 RepID=A0ABU1FUR1_9MICC|nr:MerR family transcriptional regulator [Nesterenkonia flava]MDR5712405.1 MerR family transcriptional regulator [Nesterenkonia flava]
MTDDDASSRTQQAGGLLEDTSAPFYTIGQVAEILGMQPPALRRLDEQAIVSPERSEGGQRRYSHDEVQRLREVLELTEEGVTLPGIRKVLELRQQVDELKEEVAELKGQ